MKYKKLFLPGILACFFSLPASAQQEPAIPADFSPVFSLRTSLTSWLDYDAGIMLGLNYRWSKKFSASLEPTWIFYSLYNDRNGGEVSPSGVKLRADFRYHFPRKKKKSPDTFIAPEFHYKRVKTPKEDQFGINCQGGQCAYFQEAVYTQLKNEIGGLIKAGIIVPMGFVSKKERIFLEVYLGLGVKNLRFKELDLPEGGSFVTPPVRSPVGLDPNHDRNQFSLLALPAGLKLAFNL